MNRTEHQALVLEATAVSTPMSLVALVLHPGSLVESLAG